MHELFHNYIISRVIYDEVDTIKITKCQKIDSVFHWYVTSSVNNLLQPLGTWKINYKPYLSQKI